MPLTGYPALTFLERVLTEFQSNSYIRRNYQLVLKNGEKCTGIPVATEGRPLEFAIHASDGGHFRIPFADLQDAKQVDDHYFMKLALDLSRKCTPENGKEPRDVPKVGAVLVVDGKVVDSAYRNEPLKPGEGSGDHAEMILLERKLKDQPGIAGATLYTTLEPCCSARKEPNLPCTTHITARKIQRVVIGMLDPNQDICGKGVWMLREAGVDVALSETKLTKEIEDLNREFIRKHRKAARAPTIAPATPASSAPAGEPPKVLAHSDLTQYLRAEFNFPVVYRTDGTLVTRVCLWTQQRLPSPVSIHAWRLTRVRIDGREFPSTDRFNDRVITLSEVGRTDLPEELRFSLPSHLADLAQVTISATVQLEILDQRPPPALLPVDERTCKMAK